MAIVGRSNFSVGKNNLIRNLPSLPVAMELGTISFSNGFNQQPSGSLTYEGITEEQLAIFEATYMRGINNNTPPEITLFGIPLVADSYSYDRAHYVYRGEDQFDRFKVDVSLRGKYEKRLGLAVRVASFAPRGATSITVGQLAAAAAVPYKGPNFSIKIDPKDRNLELSLQSVCETEAAKLGCFISFTHGIELKDLDAGARVWNFSTNEVIADGSNTVKGATAYNEAAITIELPEEDTEGEGGNKRRQFTKKQPKVEVLVEEDENPTSPDINTKILKTIDSNSVDGSGRKKTRKITTQVDGTTIKERVEIYGFLYTAADINTGDGELLGDPQEFWQLIEVQETNYYFESPPGLTLLVKAQTDPNNAFSTVGLVVHPDYEQIVQGGALGTSVSFTPQAKYLTRVETTGWRYCRLEKETDALETIEFVGEPDRLKLYFFKKVPKVGKSLYLLRSNRATTGQGEGENIPFSVEWKNYADLPDNIKTRVTSTNITPDARVGILTPDMNYVEPLSIIKEAEERSSFAWAPDPDSDPEDPKPPKITGEETSNTTDRIVVGTNRYREKAANFSSQNGGFSDVAESIVFKDVLGKPPEAQTMQANWEDPNNPGETNADSTDNQTKSKRYLVTTDLVGNLTPKGGTVSVPEGVKTVADMKKAIATQLRIEGLSGSQERKKISWFYPDIKDGDVVYTGADRFRGLGKPRAMSVSHTIEVKGRNNKYGILWATCDGCDLSLGLDRPRLVTIIEDKTGNPANGSDPNAQGSDPKLVVSAGATEFTLGSVVLSGPNRRNF